MEEEVKEEGDRYGTDWEDTRSFSGRQERILETHAVVDFYWMFVSQRVLTAASEQQLKRTSVSYNSTQPP